MAREGENANQPFNPEVEAAILRASEGRQVRTDFEMDADRRLATIIATPERDPLDLSLVPEKPYRTSLLWAHIKLLAAGILAHESGELVQRAARNVGSDADQQRAVAEIKHKIADKLQGEAEAELTALRRIEAEKRERTPAGSKGPLSLPEGRQMPGFDV